MVLELHNITKKTRANFDVATLKTKSKPAMIISQINHPFRDSQPEAQTEAMKYFASKKPSMSANNTIETQVVKGGQKFKIRKEKLRSKVQQMPDLNIDQAN